MAGVRIANGDTCYTGTNPNSPSPHFAQTFCDDGYELSSGSVRGIAPGVDHLLTVYKYKVQLKYC